VGAFTQARAWPELKRNQRPRHATTQPRNHAIATMGPHKCQHGVWKQWCKPCGGGGYCQHGKNKYKCQECKDAGKPTQLCDHGKPQYCCAQCGTNRCQHGNIRQQCQECGKRCTHGKRKERCAECGGGSLCTHGKRKDNKCQECTRHI